MYRETKDFISDWGYEYQSTLKLFAELNDTAMQKDIFPGGRQMGQLVWHIAYTVSEMMNHMGLQLQKAPMENWDGKMSCAAIAELYKNSAEELLKLVSSISNDDLHTETNMYGEQWKKGTTLDILIKHQAHHRGQLTLAMRQSGLKVPGMYGPSKEEWVQFGMEPLK